ncbi:MAG TPA: hypothetical protein VFZ11_03910 [Gemmatimonadaceae bacterium]
MPTASSIPENCPHERRPGLTVCLHCRHAAREAELAKRRSSLARVGIAGAVIGLGAMLATAAVRSREHAAATSVATLAAAGATSDSAGIAANTPVVAAADVHAARDTSSAAGTPAATPETPAAAPETPATLERVAAPAPAAVVAPVTETAPSAAPAPAPASPLGPVVAPGTTELPEGLSVVRVGDSLTVHFDTELGRTRRPEKFERIVRETLPMIYGAGAESLLAGVPAGAIAGAGDLLTELPAHGVRIPTADGRTLLVRPETRPGRDGPLVIRYIATVER